MRDVNWGWTNDGVNYKPVRLGDVLDLTRSPIERRLLGALIYAWLSKSPGWRLVVSNGASADLESFEAMDACRASVPFLLVTPQHEESPYTIDLSAQLGAFGRWGPKFAIECDGHDHHSTKEQRGRDASRDRHLTRVGWRVLRFTGSEIHADPDGCARELIETIVLGYCASAASIEEAEKVAAPLGLWV